MIIYEVSLNIDSLIYEEYLKWLAGHIKKIILLKGFINAQSLEEIDLEKKNNDNISTRKLIVQYQIDSLENLQEYFTLHAPAMRKENNDLYGDKVSSSRKIYKIASIPSKLAGNLIISNQILLGSIRYRYFDFIHN